MVKPRLLDLFCGAGGAAMGYHQAGFEVVGVDIVEQPRYPYEFHLADAMTFPLDDFDAIHASPPCQAYSSATSPAARSRHPDLYAPTRERLIARGLPYAIENVIGAPYAHGITLCGSMFGLEADGEWLRRHRNFETSWLMFQPPHHHRTDQRPIMITGKSYVLKTSDWKHSRQGTWELAQKLMQIDWMNRRELANAIPPAYTRFVGEQLISALNLSPTTQRGQLPEGVRDLGHAIRDLTGNGSGSNGRCYITQGIHRPNCAHTSGAQSHVGEGSPKQLVNSLPTDAENRSEVGQ